MQNFEKLCQYLKDNNIDPKAVLILIEILLKSKDIN